MHGGQTSFVHHRFILDVLRAHGKTTCLSMLETIDNAKSGLDGNPHLSVFKVSCLNLTPGARLQIKRPTELPPSASWSRRVSFEFRYGIRLFDQRDGDNMRALQVR